MGHDKGIEPLCFKLHIIVEHAMPTKLCGHFLRCSTKVHVTFILYKSLHLHLDGLHEFSQAYGLLNEAMLIIGRRGTCIVSISGYHFIKHVFYVGVQIE